jgi:hypothetical protein
MQNFFEWVRTENIKNKPWLILGKGPSFGLLKNYNQAEYNIISLNHVVRECKVKLAHCIDLDVVVSCVDSILSNADYMVIPFQPHINNAPSEKTILELMAEIPELQRIEAAGKILWYHKRSFDTLHNQQASDRELLLEGKMLKDGFPVVPVAFFSSEAAVNLLAMSGVKKVRTLGVDGGASYNNNFNDIKDKTLLANGQKTFSIQFRSIAFTIMKKNLDYAPLNVESPIRIFVGSMEEQMIATKVLEYSVKKHCSMSVEVFPLFKAGITVPTPKDPANKPRTPFSFQRFYIPQLKNFKGRAIYMDSDMHVFSDIKELWTREMEDADVLAAYEAEGTGRKPQFAVMLMDCEKLNWSVADIVKKLDDKKLTYETLMFNMAVAKKVSPVLEREWNSLEYYEEGKTCNLHYTDMNTQPWLSTANKYTDIWIKELIEAIESKFISMDYVKEHVKKSNIRPSLLYQLKYRILNPSEISGMAKRFDTYFIPPHKQAAASSFQKFCSKLAGVAASLYY